jgi:hypothetical protein
MYMNSNLSWVYTGTYGVSVAYKSVASASVLQLKMLQSEQETRRLYKHTVFLDLLFTGEKEFIIQCNVSINSSTIYTATK